jgi:hypothetical protein
LLVHEQQHGVVRADRLQQRWHHLVRHRLAPLLGTDFVVR